VNDLHLEMVSQKVAITCRLLTNVEKVSNKAVDYSSAGIAFGEDSRPLM
jgi:hypothetical protein